MVLLYFGVGSSLHVIPKRAIQKLEATQRLLPPFKGEHLEQAQRSWQAPCNPKGKPLSSHMVGGKYPVHLDTPTMIGWTHVGGGTKI